VIGRDRGGEENEGFRAMPTGSGMAGRLRAERGPGGKRKGKQGIRGPTPGPRVIEKTWAEDNWAQ